MSDEKIISIEETEDSPAILLDSGQYLLRISGASFPEDAYETYQPVVNWIAQVKDEAPKLICEFDFSILSSASNKILFELLLKLEDMYQAGKEISISWYHDDFDEDMEEEGQSFAQTVNIPFTFIPK